MHEMSLVRNVVNIVVEEAEAAKAANITKVHVVLGEGHDVVPELFESLFQFLARGTVAQHAQVELHHVPYMAKCNRCGQEFHLIPIDQRTWTCPRCGAYKDYQLTSGMEFYISKIEASRHAPVEQKDGTIT